MSAQHNPLSLPLEGVRVVEASAGTGKTFTIATLYLRLILERGLLPEQIVVATFTRAATAELSERLRARVQLADEMLARDDAAPTGRADESGDARAARSVIAKALAAGAELAALRKRAHDARLSMDAAMIGTLHAFCHRVLSEFGFETGRALTQPELLEDVRGLADEIVADFWRRASADAETARSLADTWGSPAALANQLGDPRWREREVEVAEPHLASMQVECESLRARIAAWSEPMFKAAEAELQECFSHGAARTPRMKALHALQGWACAQADQKADAVAFDQASRFLAENEIESKVFVRHSRGEVFELARALCASLNRFQDARNAQAALPAACLLRDAHFYLQSELPRRLRARNLVGHDQAVDSLAAALADPAHSEALPKIRARWKAALIDEFQDTDKRQWQIVQSLFGTTTLVLVGDPKQAIYGFRGGDVHAWLAACAQRDGEPLRLVESYRAGGGMTRAINALFSAPGAFIESGIAHPDVSSADVIEQRALLRNGMEMLALQCWRLPENRNDQGELKSCSKAQAWPLIESACVAWLVQLLADARAEIVQLRGKSGQCERLHPKHVAVLVNTNAQAASLQAALARVGLPASSNLLLSVYASDEAAELQWLLDALCDPADARRARAAWASALVGGDSAGIAASNNDADAQSRLLETVARWADEVARHGPLPWLHALIAQAAPRLLALPDGERRVANYLQLAELLQEQHASCFGVDDLATGFARARVEAADDADNARLRLDTDADAVTVSTLHAAKGLEYEVVLLPCAPLIRNPDRSRGAVPLSWYHDDRGNARVTIGAGVDATIAASARQEERAEDVRKLYVGVTRACALCVLPWGPIKDFEHSAAFWLLHRAGREHPLQGDDAGCDRALHELCERAHGAAEIVPLPIATHRKLEALRDDVQSLAARSFARAIERDWRTWSFSRLVRGAPRGDDADPAPGSGDVAPGAAAEIVAMSTMPPLLAGARFGSAVHAALEKTDFAAWRDAIEIPDTQRGLIERSLRAQGLPDAGGIGVTRSIEIVGDCMRGALNVALGGVRLCDLPPQQRRAEMEFYLRLSPARANEFLALLHAHNYQRGRGGLGVTRLHGLLTGVIDLVFEHAGRYHLVDYKTNYLTSGYDSNSLRAAMDQHDYDLQYLLYTLALHRWLRQTLPDYDYDEHIGETYYLFLRGLPDGQGVYRDRAPRELIEAMDTLFEMREEVAA